MSYFWRNHWNSYVVLRSATTQAIPSALNSYCLQSTIFAQTFHNRQNILLKRLKPIFSNIYHQLHFSNMSSHVRFLTHISIQLFGEDANKTCILMNMQQFMHWGDNWCRRSPKRHLSKEGDMLIKSLPLSCIIWRVRLHNVLFIL